jgi:hypothetical protein
MADAFGGAGSAGGGGYGGGTSGQYGPLSSQTYYADPNAAGDLIQRLIQNMQTQSGNLNSFIANPTASPLYQGQLQGLLGALAPDEQRGATNLQDIFRNAGNTSSSTFGSAANQYQGDVQRNHQELASKLLGQSFQQIVGALLPQIQQGPQLLEAMRLSQSYRAPQQQSVSSSGGSSTPSSSLSGSTAQPNNSLQQLLSALGGGQYNPATNGGGYNPDIYSGGQGTAGGGAYNPIDTYMQGGEGTNGTFIGMPEGGSIDSAGFYPGE